MAYGFADATHRSVQTDRRMHYENNRAGVSRGVCVTNSQSNYRIAAIAKTPEAKLLRGFAIVPG
jgi:hypothetical protein